MNRTMSWSLLLSLATTSVLTLSLVTYVDARPQRAQGQARASVNRAPPPSAQRAQRINTGNTAQRASNVNAGNRANAGNTVNSGNRANAGNTVNSGNRANAGNTVNSGNRANTGNTVGNRTNINNSTRNVNIDNSRDVDIDVDGQGRYGYDDHYHPLAAAAAVTATVAVTAAVVGSIFTPAQLPPSCVQVIQYNTAYMQCGSTWYQPQYQGSDVTYVVVNAP
ncbi:hypothetical protein MO767_23895 [Pseudomonas sp. UYIF39]|uniref:hypothetical protein n=1 Tax=Pseudomonas sp. UYIF39 TaxID=1630747 RepID=UPI00249F3852|nr:hypothetical protein [Pseudomonas sp. UYIF39]MDI3357373.1 hypothetical protein [Pseudomonas sp. UYIF39]